MTINQFLEKEAFYRNTKIFWNYTRLLWLIIPACICICFTSLGLYTAVTILVTWFLMARHDADERRIGCLRQLYEGNKVTAMFVFANRGEMESIDVFEYGKLVEDTSKILKEYVEKGEITEEQKGYYLANAFARITAMLELANEVKGSARIDKIPMTKEVREDWENRVIPEDLTPEFVREVADRFHLNDLHRQRNELIKEAQDKWNRMEDFEKRIFKSWENCFGYKDITLKRLNKEIAELEGK